LRKKREISTRASRRPKAKKRRRVTSAKLPLDCVENALERTNLSHLQNWILGRLKRQLPQSGGTDAGEQAWPPRKSHRRRTRRK
jgi:hypothetical protein